MCDFQFSIYFLIFQFFKFCFGGLDPSLTSLLSVRKFFEV